jgi:glycosyltransferase involved in cell wall biosynthesis
LKGINYLNQKKEKTDIVVFIDGDFSDYPEDLVKITKPIIEKDIDFVTRISYEKFKRERINATTANLWKLVSYLVNEIFF